MKQILRLHVLAAAAAARQLNLAHAATLHVGPVGLPAAPNRHFHSARSKKRVNLAFRIPCVAKPVST